MCACVMQRSVWAGGMWQMTTKCSTTQTQIGTSHNDKCLIPSGLVSKIYKRDILVRFVGWILCDAAQCRGMWQMTTQWYSSTTQTQIGASHIDKCLIPSELVSKYTNATGTYSRHGASAHGAPELASKRGA